MYTISYNRRSRARDAGVERQQGLQHLRPVRQKFVKADGFAFQGLLVNLAYLGRGLVHLNVRQSRHDGLLFSRTRDHTAFAPKICELWNGTRVVFCIHEGMILADQTLLDCLQSWFSLDPAHGKLLVNPLDYLGCIIRAESVVVLVLISDERARRRTIIQNAPNPAKEC